MEKEKYDPMRIEDLEQSVLSNSKEMINVLLYLKTSGRYKENQTYRNSNFQVYIRDRFNLNYRTYMEMQKAFTKYPEETAELGAGLVADVIKTCGTQAKNAFEAINKKSQSCKTALPRKKIQTIISQFEIKKPEVQSVQVDKNINWEAKYKIDVPKLQAELREAYKTIKDLREQNEKLKETAKIIPDIRALVNMTPKSVNLAGIH